jgi:hypothetical protein
MPIRKNSWIVGFSGGLYEIQGPFWKIMDCKHIFLKVQGFICKIMDCKHIFLKAWGLICKKWWTAVMIFAKWNIFFSKRLLLGHYGLSVRRSDGRERPTIMFGCSVNLWQIKAFLVKVWGLRVGCIEV